MWECNAPCWAAFTCVDSRLHGSGVRSPPLHCAPGCTAPGWTESSRIAEMKLNRWGGMARCSHGGAMGVQRAVLGCVHVRGFAFAWKWVSQSALALRSGVHCARLD